MAAYWIVFFVIGIYCILFPKYDGVISRPSFHLVIWLLLITLFLFAGLRTESNDYGGYQKFYEKVPSLDDISLNYISNNNIPVEKGFILLMSFLKLFSSNIVMLMLVVAGFSVYLNIKVIEKLSPYVFLSILLYYSHNFLLKETVQIRQGLASALIILTFLFHSDVAKRTITILVAGLIQSTAFTALIPYFFSNIINRISSRILILIICIVLAFSLVISGSDLLILVLNSIGLPPAVSAYVGYDLFDYSLGFFSPVFVKMIIILSLLFIYRQNLNERYNFFPIVFSFYYFGVLWFIYFNDFAIIAARISNMFTLGDILLIPMLIEVGSKKYKYYFYFAAIAFCFMNLFFNLRTEMVFPYKNVIFK